MYLINLLFIPIFFLLLLLEQFLYLKSALLLHLSHALLVYTLAFSPRILTLFLISAIASRLTPLDPSHSFSSFFSFAAPLALLLPLIKRLYIDHFSVLFFLLFFFNLFFNLFQHPPSAWDLFSFSLLDTLGGSLFLLLIHHLKIIGKYLKKVGVVRRVLLSYTGE